MKFEDYTDRLKEPIEREESQKGDFLMAAFALLVVSYSQTLNLNKEDEAKDFWPFENFSYNVDTKENLIEACRYIIAAIKKI